MQRERQQMRKRERNALLGEKAAHPRIAFDRDGIERYGGPHQPEQRQIARAVALEALDDARQRPRIQVRGFGQFRQHDRFQARRAEHRTGVVERHDGHAPIRLCPHTRTTWPVTPAEPGCASQAMVWATSAGWPPWLIEFIRRPASRSASGIFAVICVSMKPGATALIVMRRAARYGAMPCTRPITPAFDAA